jgi:hypothetical protein
MANSIDYSATARIARELGATLDQANEARYAAMSGTVDGRHVYNEQRYRKALAAR